MYFRANNNCITALDIEGISVSYANYMSLNGQSILEPLSLVKQDNSEYMTEAQTGNVIPESVKGIDENGDETETSYESGTARFKIYPARVKYEYKCGQDFFSMEVKIGVPDHMVKSLNNHVYRIFTRGMNWNNVKEYCESLGGHLPAIDTTKGTEELYLLRDMIGSALDEGEMIIVHVRVGGYGLNNVWH